MDARWGKALGSIVASLLVLQTFLWGSVVGVSTSLADQPDHVLYVPRVGKGEVCSPIPGEDYQSIGVNPPPTDRPAEQHADLNLSLRGYETVDEHRGLVDYSGGTDSSAPNLKGLFADARVPDFVGVFQVHDWDWANNRRGSLIQSPRVTLVALGGTAGEIVRVPASGYSIGSGYEVLVLYASTDRVTLKYTRDDNVKKGYAVHLEDLCVDPRLITLYEQCNAAGRSKLPALKSGQGIGRIREGSVGVAIRDTGAFMDPRSRKDWWQ